MEVYRGDIFYVNGVGPVTGSEQKADRPAIIVSNDSGNKYSGVCEVVYLTGVAKKPMPTHVKIMCRIPSTALCEQITSISKEKLGNFIRSCTKEEMEEIDKALAISIGIENVNIAAGGAYFNNNVSDEKTNEELKNNVEKMKKSIDILKEKIGIISAEDEKIRIETERDLYKKLYEQAFLKIAEK